MGGLWICGILAGAFWVVDCSGIFCIRRTAKTEALFFKRREKEMSKTTTIQGTSKSLKLQSVLSVTLAILGVVICQAGKS